MDRLTDDNAEVKNIITNHEKNIVGFITKKINK